MIYSRNRRDFDNEKSLGETSKRLNESNFKTQERETPAGNIVYQSVDPDATNRISNILQTQPPYPLPPGSRTLQVNADGLNEVEEDEPSRLNPEQDEVDHRFCSDGSANQDNSDKEEVKVEFNRDNDHANQVTPVLFKTKTNPIIDENVFNMVRMINKRELKLNQENNSDSKNKSDIDQIQEFMVECDEELKSLGQNSNRKPSIEEFEPGDIENDHDRNRLNSEHIGKRKTVVEITDRANFNRSVLVQNRPVTNTFVDA